MKELIVSRTDEGQRINKYLLKYLGSAPSSFIYKMMRKKNITLNGSKVKGDEILKENDSIKLFLSDETISNFQNEKNNSNANTNISANNANLKIDDRILYIDDDILVVDKPVGVLSQKADKNDYSINEAIIEYCLHKNIIDNKMLATFKPSVCNRLDRNTSGIIFAGISLKGSKYLGSILKDRTMDKYYFTIVNGVLDKKLDCDGYITKDSNKNVSKVISKECYQKLKSEIKNDYTYINTSFVPVSSNGKFTLLKIKLITGKTHQIRAHLKHLGYPVLGDVKYGNECINRLMREKYKLKNHLLYAGEVIIYDYPFSNDIKDLIIKAKMPDTFEKICKAEGLKY